jgi:hypothetical protein
VGKLSIPCNPGHSSVTTAGGPSGLRMAWSGGAGLGCPVTPSRYAGHMIPSGPYE